jgi:hypothetical protein
MKRHEVAIHEGKKPFNCMICDANFASRQNLNKHVASVHEGNICDASFTQNGDLNKHKAAVHEGKINFKG